MSKANAELEALRAYREQERLKLQQQQLEQQEQEQKDKERQQQRQALLNKTKMFEKKNTPTSEEVIRQQQQAKRYQKDYAKVLSDNNNFNPLALELKLKSKHQMATATNAKILEEQVAVPDNFEKVLLSEIVNDDVLHRSSCIVNSENENGNNGDYSGGNVVYWVEFVTDGGEIRYKRLNNDRSSGNSNSDEELFTTAVRPPGVAVVVVESDVEGVEDEDWQVYENNNSNGSDAEANHDDDVTVLYCNLRTEEIVSERPNGYLMIVQQL